MIEGKTTRILLYWLLLQLLNSPLALALESDADQPITVDSNSATYDDRNGISTYIGNVVAVQGSMVMNSDKLVVYIKNGEVEKLVATGNPTRFKQLPSEGAEEIRGESLTAEYYPDQALLILIDDAVVTQDNSTYASEIIKYDSRNALVKAGDESSDTKRVRVTLKPKAREKVKVKETPEDGQAESKKTDQELQQ